MALVRDGDWIELDVAGRRLHLDIDDAERATKKEAPHEAGQQAPRFGSQ